MKKPKIFFNPIEGSSILSLTWFPGPLGDAVEANNGIGVGYFSPTGEILGVMFDDVSEKQDHQVLEFDRYRIEVTMKNGRVSHSMTPIEPKMSRSKPRSSRRRDVA